MSHIENVVQGPSHDRRISHRQQHIPCGRCYAVIEYDRGAVWSVVSELVNEHWRACPGKPHARPACMTRTPTCPPSSTIVVSPPAPVAARQSGTSNPGMVAAESVDPPNTSSAWIAPGCERKRRTLEQRKLELERDEYAKNVTTKSVVCGGCHKEISLDKRSKYYPGLWVKHRDKCPGIKKLECARARAPEVQNGTRQVPCDVVLPALGSSSYGSVVQVTPVEHYEILSAGSVHQDDSEYPSSDDEDEDREMLSQEPFPTQNSDFYEAQLSSNYSDVWAYRYATKDEITTNLFRGQVEPYGRPHLAHVGVQTGGEREASRCVMSKRVERAVSQPEISRPAEE